MLVNSLLLYYFLLNLPVIAVKMEIEVGNSTSNTIYNLYPKLLLAKLFYCVFAS